MSVKQFPPGILKFSTKHEDNPFTLNCYMVPCTFLFIFYAGSRRLVLIIFRTQVIKKKQPVRPVFLDYLSVSYDCENKSREVIKISP